MKNLSVSKNWPHHFFPLFLTLIALAVMILAPIWAIQWARQPFIGIFLEPHQVVSLIVGQNWPAKQAGVQGYDRLLALNDHPIENSLALGELLEANGYQPVNLSFESQDGHTYAVTVTPRRFSLGELFNWFGVPYAV